MGVISPHNYESLFGLGCECRYVLFLLGSLRIV